MSQCNEPVSILTKVSRTALYSSSGSLTLSSWEEAICSWAGLTSAILSVVCLHVWERGSQQRNAGSVAMAGTSPKPMQQGSVGLQRCELSGSVMALAAAAVCLPERLLFWTPSIEDTNCIIHGGQTGNGKNEWWKRFLLWQKRSREAERTITGRSGCICGFSISRKRLQVPV